MATASRTLKLMVKTPQSEITMICLQARCQATVRAVLFGAHRVRTGVLSLSKMGDGHQPDLEETGDGLQKNARAFKLVQARLFQRRSHRRYLELLL